MNPHDTVGQSEFFALLQDPETYGLASPVKRIDTHGAAVFLAGPDVYKIKRAVRFPFMDFSTLAKRAPRMRHPPTIRYANVAGPRGVGKCRLL